MINFAAVIKNTLNYELTKDTLDTCKVTQQPQAAESASLAGRHVHTRQDQPDGSGTRHLLS